MKKRNPKGYWTKEKCHEIALKYTTKTEFKEKDRDVYNISYKKGWYKEITTHMIELYKYWTKEKCQDVSLLCKTRTEFQEEYGSAYHFARENKFLDEICSHMIEGKKSKGYWSKEKCKKLALLCKSKTEFREKHGDAYSFSRSHKFLNEICSHMISKNKPKGYWTKEKCHEIALKYTTKPEFKKGSYDAYQATYKNKWVNEICSHMIELSKAVGYWTKEKCYEIALKCETRGQFQKEYYNVYRSAYESKWLDEICSHMKVQGSRFFRFVYVFIFSDNFVYIGLTYNVKNREKEHLNKKKSQVYKHIEKTNSKYIIKIITKNPIPKEEAQILEHETKLEYIKNGYNILNVGKTGKGSSVGGTILIWTKEKCQEVALKCTTKTEFKNDYSGAYNSALKNKWIKEICLHMISKNKPSGYWKIKENCKEAALEFDNRTDFLEEENGAYISAWKNGWLDEICSHMNTKEKKPRGYWMIKENCKEEALKYKTKQEFNEKSHTAYVSSRDNKFLDEICSHMN